MDQCGEGFKEYRDNGLCWDMMHAELTAPPLPQAKEERVRSVLGEESGREKWRGVSSPHYSV